MYHIICALIIVLLTSCSTSSHNHKGHKHSHKQHQQQNKLNHKVINHNHIDRGDHIQIIIKHRSRLSKYERKQIKKWCHNHYRHHNKPVKCKFVIAG